MDLRFALLLACFALSGFAALLYQTVWTRELSFVFGTSELAVAAVLAAYMGGLSLGAAVAARIAPRVRRPVWLYGWLELAIAVSALAVPLGIRALGALYVGLLGGAAELQHGSAANALLQLAGSFAVLLLPTALMGATLPLLARYAVHSDREIAARVGGLYAMNTAGAIAGTLCAAFWLIPELGLRRAVWVGAGLNGAVFALAAVAARGAAPALAVESGSESEASDRSGRAAARAAWILPAMAVSGAVSFAYEVLWTRLLGHVLGASLAAFATMLASFLLGIALGSTAAARFARTRERARTGFALAQLGIALTSYGAFALADRVPALERWLSAGPAAPLASAAIAVAALLPITLCIGATFPLAVRWLTLAPEQTTRATARVYAWNTIGAIAGALGAGFVLLPQLGFEGTLALGVAVSLLLAVASAWFAAPRRAALAAVAIAALGVLPLLPPTRPEALLRQSSLRSAPLAGEILYTAVGRSSTVMLTDQGALFRLATNGLPEAVIDRAGVVPLPGIVARWLGLLPTLVRPETREVLVVGLGGATALESVPSSVERVDAIELEPEVLAANRVLSGARARDPLADPRVRVHFGDARGSLALTAKRYGAIVSQPSHPWTAGASHLYTREFFSLVRSRLEPDGVFVQWIGMPFIDEALLQSLLSALVEVFGHVEVYWPGERGVLFAASPAPIAGLAGAARALAATPDDYARDGLFRVEDFASAWLLDEDGARELARGTPPNSDDENELASRAWRLGDRALGESSLRALVAPHDPLRDARGDLDRGAVLRALVLRGGADRALELARGDGGAAAERGQGWVEVTNNRARSGARHFARALAIEPGDRDALRGLVLSRRTDLARGPIPELSESALDAPAAALIAGWRRADERDWSRVAELDAEIAQIGRGDPLFREASRLRARWRLESGDRSHAAEAVAIEDAVLRNFWHGEDALLHARAAVAAGLPESAWPTLARIAELAPPTERGSDLMKRALEIADRLAADGAGAAPTSGTDDWRPRLERVRADLRARSGRRERT